MLSGTNQIFIGASNKSTNISGSAINMSGLININTPGTTTTTIGNIQSTTNISGTVNINSDITNIGTAGLSATGKVNIASGTNVAGSEIIMGSTTLTKCYIRGGDVNINHTTGANIFMGSTTGGGTNIIGNVTLGADTLINPTAQSTNITIGTANSMLRLYTPITPLFAYPVASDKIGYYDRYTWGNGNTGQNEWKTIADFTNKPIGMYLLTVGPFVYYDHGSDKVVHVQFISNPNVNYLSIGNAGSMELGGNAMTKSGLCFSLPLIITSGSNQINVRLYAAYGGFSFLGGGSSLLRIG